MSYSMHPKTYASTNPFLTGAYMSYTPGDMGFDKFNTIGSTKDVKSFFSESATHPSETTKYSTLSSKPSYEVSESSVFTSAEQKNNAGKYSSYLGTGYGSDLKYSPGKTSGSSYDTSPNVTQSSGCMLGVEDTPTPTSSIETEDSTTREVGEKDVEGDGEQSD